MPKIELRKDAFKRIKDLAAEEIADIDNRLLSGQSSKQVAVYIQNVLEKCTDIQVTSLEKTLDRYRKSELKNRVLDTVAQSIVQEGLPAVAKKLNALELMTELVEKQLARYTHAHGKELATLKMLGDGPATGLNKIVTQEGIVLQNMLVDLGKLQLDTGVMQRAPKRIIGQLADANGDVRKFEWTEAQDRLYRELETVIDAAQDE